MTNTAMEYRETSMRARVERPSRRPAGCQIGVSLVELMVALGVLLVIAGVVTAAIVQMINTQGTVTNRTEMHSAVRSVTELLQQEIGQAGRISLPYSNQNPALNNIAPTLLTNVVSAPGTPPIPVTLSSTVGMFNGEQIVVDAGSTAAGLPKQETVTVSPNTLSGNSLNAAFITSHLTGAPIAVLGAFSSGIVPPVPAVVQSVNGTVVAQHSDPQHLRIFGDINGDGNTVIVQYDCNPNAAGTGTLTRSVTDWNNGVPGQTITLLNNIANNPPPNAGVCFNYQTQVVNIGGVPVTFVTDVAVTLTVQTQFQDPVTKQFQQETKALLNISPRNIFDIWECASQGIYERVQPMPDKIATLLNQIQ